MNSSSALLKLLLLSDIMYRGSTILVNIRIYKVNTLVLYEKNNKTKCSDSSIENLLHFMEVENVDIEMRGY